MKQLQSDTIVDDVRDALATSGFSPAHLVLEITETVMMADMDLAVDRLNALKALGVKLAMDDFGTGYSSLSYLSRLPVDILKMDRSFLTSGDAISPLPQAIVRIGETLDLEVVAEGIEQPMQATHLRELGLRAGPGLPVRPRHGAARPGGVPAPRAGIGRARGSSRCSIVTTASTALAGSPG